MKIKGPSEPAGAAESSPLEQTRGTSFVDKLEREGATASPSGAIKNVSESLRTGGMAPSDALKELVTHCVEHQIGSSAPRPLREKMIADVVALCDQDPMIAAKLAQIAAKLRT